MRAYKKQQQNFNIFQIYVLYSKDRGGTADLSKVRVVVEHGWLEEVSLPDLVELGARGQEQPAGIMYLTLSCTVKSAMHGRGATGGEGEGRGQNCSLAKIRVATLVHGTFGCKSNILVRYLH